MEIKIDSNVNNAEIAGAYAGINVNVLKGNVIVAFDIFDKEDAVFPPREKPYRIAFYLPYTEHSDFRNILKAERIRQAASIPADVPMPEHIKGVYKVGNSGIGFRNSWNVDIPKVKQKCYIAYKFNYGENFHLVRGEYKIPDIKMYQEKKAMLKEYRSEYWKKACRETLNDKLKNFDAVVISEYNKSPYFMYAPEEFIGFRVKTTSCGNTTACIVRKRKHIKVPDEIKGLVIGKKGRRIKWLSEQAGFRMIVC